MHTNMSILRRVFSKMVVLFVYLHQYTLSLVKKNTFSGCFLLVLSHILQVAELQVLH